MHYSSSHLITLLIVLWHFVSLALALFEGCNHRINLNAGEKIYINSPYYPSKYPVGSSCRYTVQAPRDYELQFKCKIDLSTVSSSTRCLNEIFYFNREGSELLSGSEYFCGSGSMDRKSFLNRAVISYISTATATTTTTSAKIPYVYSTAYAKINPPEEVTQSPKYEMTIDFEQQMTPKSELSTETNTNSTTDVTTTEAATEVVTTTRTTTTTAMPASLNLLTRKPTAIAVAAVPVPSTTPTTTFGFLLAALTWRKNFSSSSFAASTTLSTTKSNSSSGSSNSSRSNTSLHQARIIDRNSAIFPSTAVVGSGGGSFSCLIEVLEPPCDCGWSMSAKVAGNSAEAGIYEFPSMAGVLTVRDSKIFCGAAIIHHRYLLTAAHCFTSPGRDSPDYIGVVVGEHDFSTVFETLLTRTYQIEAIIPHENFRNSADAVRNDIALLRTRIAIEWNRSVGPTCLPFRSLVNNGNANSTRKPPIAGQRLDVAGWGTTTFGGPQSTRLLKTTLDVITRDACRRSVPNLESNTFCTYTPGRDACQYDSGGSLYARENRLFAVGIVSYGFGCATEQPSVNTRVASYIQWIQSKTPEVRYCVK